MLVILQLLLLLIARSTSGRGRQQTKRRMVISLATQTTHNCTSRHQTAHSSGTGWNQAVETATGPGLTLLLLRFYPVAQLSADLPEEFGPSTIRRD